MNLDNIRRILTQPQMEVSACKKKCWRHLVFAQRLSFFIASYLTDEHLEPTKSIQDNRSKNIRNLISSSFSLISYLSEWISLSLKSKTARTVVGGPKTFWEDQRAKGLKKGCQGRNLRYFCVFFISTFGGPELISRTRSGFVRV